MKLFLRSLLIVFVFESHGQISDFSQIDFSIADVIATKNKGHDLNNLTDLVFKLTDGLNTDVERFRAMFVWVCSNITNNYSLYTKNSRKRKRYINNPVLLENWNTEFKKEIFKKLLEEQSTICTGYAYLMKEMANIANIECEIVHGYGKTSTMNIETITEPNHSWNAVKLNDKWYLCDPTWASGLIDPDTFQFKFEFKEGLFLPSPDLFVMNHFPVDNQWMLLSEKQPTFEMFLEAPLIYNKAYAKLNGHVSPTKMNQTIKKRETIAFKYMLANPEIYNEISLLIDDGHKTITTKPINSKILEDILTFEHQFEKNGFYDVHLLIDNDLISTYTFKVKG